MYIHVYILIIYICICRYTYEQGYDMGMGSDTTKGWSCEMDLKPTLFRARHFWKYPWFLSAPPESGLSDKETMKVKTTNVCVLGADIDSFFF